MISASLVVGIVILWACVLVSRQISSKALEYLDQEQKAKLLDAFSGFRLADVVPGIVFVVGYFALLFLFPQVLAVGFSALFVLYVVVAVWSLIHGQRRLTDLDLPGEYKNRYLLARAIRYAGILGLFVVLWWGFMPL